MLVERIVIEPMEEVPVLKVDVNIFIQQVQGRRTFLAEVALETKK